MEGIATIPFMADIGDLLELLIPIAFVAIYLIGNVAKSMAEKKEQDKRQNHQEDVHIEKRRQSTAPYVQRQSQQMGSSLRAQRLPYAKNVSQPPQDQQKSYLQKMEELRQKRLAEIRMRQQAKPPKTIQPPPASRQPALRPPVRPRPRPIYRTQPSQQNVPVISAIPVAKPVHEVHKTQIPKKRKAEKKTKSDTGKVIVSHEIIGMLKNPKYIKNAILASEILGKPVSLR